MDNKYFKRALLFLYAFVVCCVIYVVLDGPIVGTLISKPYYGYSVLLGMLCLFLALLILYKSRSFPPSIVIFLVFLVGPFIGPFGDQIYEKIHGLFHGVGLNFAYPTFVWSVGTTAFLVGVCSAHYLIPTPIGNDLVKWNSQRAIILVWVAFGVAFSFTLYALLKIGYIPVLSFSLAETRAGFEAIVGDYPLKFSRLWVVVASLAAMVAFLKTRRKLYLSLVLISCLASMVYGQRIYLFMILVSFVLMYMKFFRPRLTYLVPGGFALVVLLILYSEFRAGHSTSQLSVAEVTTLQLMGEWREYSLVVNELKKSGEFYKEDIFMGALAPLFPKQIWAAFGIDKTRLIRDKSAVFLFGRMFDNPILGIRLGTIGEAYAGYGLFYGVCLQLFLFGVIVGLLEKVYLKLKKEDARLCLVCFLIALLIYLPLTTLYVTTASAVFFGFFFVVCCAWGSFRVRQSGEAARAY